MSACRVKSILFSLFLIWCVTVFSQQTDSLNKRSVSDTDTSGFQNKLKKIRTQELELASKSLEKYKAGKISIKQNELFEMAKRLSEQEKNFLKSGLDTIGIAKKLNDTRASLDIVSDGIFTNKGTAQTQRNLTVSESIVSTLLVKTLDEKKIIDSYVKTLIHFRTKMDSISIDSAIYLFPSDSASFVKYVQRLSVIAKEIGPVDDAIDTALVRVQDIQNRIDLMVFQIRSTGEDLAVLRKNLSLIALKREFANIWGEIGFSRKFSEILHFSFAKEKLALTFYIEDNAGRLVVMFLLVLVSTLFLRSLKARLKANNQLDLTAKEQLVVKSPVLSAIIIVTSLFQFFFVNPPFIFNFCLWAVAIVSLAIIFKNYIAPYWMRFWICMILFFFLAGGINFILQASREERWFMLVLSLTGVFYCLTILLGKHWHETKEKRIIYFIIFVLVLEMTSALFNIYGRYNFSKNLLAIGFIGVAIAIVFLWVARLINEGLALASRLYEYPDRKLLYINFNKLGEKVPSFFYVLLIVGWFILVARNFYAYKQFVDPFRAFLTKERSIGDYTFSIYGLSIFIIIMLCSLALSRITSFFASDSDVTHSNSTNKPKIGLGSWLLLVRIIIISLGLFLAIAATGVPLDRITIVIGALGVGIGLGLQSLVNSLVSGLIIAFEKPVNVGDIVEISGKAGTVKSIGFRSSVVTLFDGSCVVVPNGDILSQHVVNWTMGKNIKRLIIPVGVAYGSDLEKVRSVLMKTMEADERILHYPSPVILAKEFSPSSIDLELRFWARSIYEAVQLNSDVIFKIDLAFKEAGITIPFPQQDIHIRKAE